MQIASMPRATLGLNVYVDCGSINNNGNNDIYYTVYMAFDDFSLTDADAVECPVATAP